MAPHGDRAAAGLRHHLPLPGIAQGCRAGLARNPRTYAELGRASSRSRRLRETPDAIVACWDEVLRTRSDRGVLELDLRAQLRLQADLSALAAQVDWARALTAVQSAARYVVDRGPQCSPSTRSRCPAVPRPPASPGSGVSERPCCPPSVELPAAVRMSGTRPRRPCSTLAWAAPHARCSSNPSARAARWREGVVTPVASFPRRQARWSRWRPGLVPRVSLARLLARLLQPGQRLRDQAELLPDRPQPLIGSFDYSVYLAVLGDSTQSLPASDDRWIRLGEGVISLPKSCMARRRCPVLLAPSSA